MRLEIFDVGHGACALVTGDNGTRMMIDCGHRADPLWLPGVMLRQRSVSTLDLLYITNYDEDHVSGICNLLDLVNVSWIVRNASVSPETIRSLKTENGMGAGIERLTDALTHTFTGSPSILDSPPQVPGLSVSTFANVYPAFRDENNLSLVVHLDCHGVGVMFTGDMETAGFAPLLEDPVFRDRLQRTSVFVAPHHGRVSGCCDTVAQHCRPFYVVISDKSHVHETQQTHAHYQAMAQGGPFRGETRHVLTTRSDGHITIDVPSPLQWFIS